MISDVSTDDLHRFADHIGLSRRAFHGDHYDLPAHVRDRALMHGAIEVPSRQLVLILRHSGLRLSPAQRRIYTHGTDVGQESGSLSNDRGQ
ncbi:MAG: hypothetical protein RIR69_1013 [Actinomycetota bacterium]|jgi:hypothetical protein